jgi:UDP-N-acetylmuramate dehydrogenase
LNSFGLDVVASYFFEIKSVDAISKIIVDPVFKEKQYLILGGGCNTLFQNDFYNGLVLYVNNKGIEIIEETNTQCVVRVQAGEDWPSFVDKMVALGLFGVENLTGIPGKVGAAPVQNIGAYGAELKDVFLRAFAVNLSDGTTREFTNAACCFSYRNSIFKNELKGKYLIYAIDFLLKKNAPLNLSYSAIRAYLNENQITDPSLKMLSEIISSIRTSKIPDPKTIGNAGSFFKNPVVDRKQFLQIQAEFPDVSFFEEARGNVKIAAAWLIEKTGWKGYCEGDAGVYDKHVLVLVNHGKAKGNEIIALAQKIQESVQKKFGLKIEPEVNIV